MVKMVEMRKKTKTKKAKGSISLLLEWAGKDKRYLYASITCAAVSSLCSIIPYYIFYKIIDAVYNKTYTSDELISYSVILLISIALRFLVFASSGMLSHKGAYNTLFQVRCMVTEHMSKMPLGSLNERNTGEIKTIMNENIEKLELSLAHHLPELVMYLLGPIVMFFYLAYIHLPLALISLIPLVLAVCVVIVMFKKNTKLMKNLNETAGDLSSSIIEYISGMRLIKAYNMGTSSFKKYSTAIDDSHSLWVKMSKKLGPLYASYIVILECGLLFLVPLGGFLFMNGSITASILLLFAFVGTQYLSDIRPLQEIGTNFAFVLNGISQVKTILDTPIFEGKCAFPSKHDIELKNVSFFYTENKEILKNCSISIMHGEKIAFVGKSGSGKTTAVQLISRFYDVTGGEIRIGGRNINDINYEELLENISIVFQNSFLTRGSVFENIAMGSNATLDDVRMAAKKAQIDDFIMKLPDGYQTSVGAYGTRFSGGEKQRICIARAVLKNAPILILDEATSAADPENQLEIDIAIENLCKGKTVIIVAHRLGIVKNCDKIAVFEEDGITCTGKWDDVLKNNQYFQKTWLDYSKARDIHYELRGGVQA